MTSKVPDGQCSNEVTTTPRRLRSGNYYGDQNIQTPLPSKKESKETKDSNQSCDIENPPKDDKTKASKHYPNTSGDKQMRQNKGNTSGSPLTESCSPDHNQKSHNLKAILESIQPNLNLKAKGKLSKRKSLRYILDQKLCKDKAESEQAKDQSKQHAKTKKRPVVNNGENHHKSKNCSKEAVKLDTSDHKTDSQGTKKQTTMHTRTAAKSSHAGTVKEDQRAPDDHWVMKRNYTDKNSAKTSSPVELRIKADTHSRDQDDRSQTFRINCSRPESGTSTPTTSLPRNMKPDIVLKVRPRSSSLSTLSGTTPAVLSNCQARLESAAYPKLCSTITSLSLGSDLRSACNLEAPDDLHSAQGESQTRSFSSGLQHTMGFVLQPEDCPDPDRPNALDPFPAAKPFVVDYEDVLEESNLPPVARTVELLSEPHDVHLANINTDTYSQVSTYSASPIPHHHPTCSYGDQDLGSIPDLRPSLSATFSATSPEGEGFQERERERENANCEDARGRKHGPRHHPNTGKASTAALAFPGRGGSSPAMAAPRHRVKKEVEEKVEVNGGKCAEDSARTPVRSRPPDRTLGVQETNESISNVPSEELGSSRRRRKGRPSRRASACTERRWNYAHLYPLSPEEGEGEGAEEEEGEGGCREKGGGPGRKDEGLREETAAGKSAEMTGKPSTAGVRCRCSVDRERRGASGAASITITTRKGVVKRQGESSGGGRRSRKTLDLETLWANPELDTHGFLLWASENRSSLEKQLPDATGMEVEGQLAAQWSQLPFSAKLHFLCRARDASTDHKKPIARKKKASSEKNDNSFSSSSSSPTTPSPSSSDGGRLVYEFLRLPQERQKDLLRKWLRFFQKMLPRLEYQDFIGDFKKACKSLTLRPVTARRKNARLRNLDPSHYHMLFEKIRETRPRVMSVYNKRKAREEQLLSQSFCAMVRHLIVGQTWPFVRGCRSKVLGELLKDIQQLEVEEVLAQIDLTPSLTSANLADPFLDTKGLHDPLGSVSGPVGAAVDPAPSNPAPPQTGTPNATSSNTKDAGHSRKGPSSVGSSPTSAMTSASASSNSMTSSGDFSGELPDSPLVLKMLDSLRHVMDLPVLDQRCLDSIFLAPPSRGSSSRGQASRETQFQNSATYRRTLLYKHIQPLLDARGMPLPSSALYHTHSAQFFYSDDR